MRARPRHPRYVIPTVIAGLLAGCVTVPTDDGRPIAAEPGHTRNLPVTKGGAPVVIDGSVNDDAWSAASASGDFWISSQQRLPSERTEVLVTADDDNLYFAFRCYDSQPEMLQSRQTRRDAKLGFDDQVAVELDPFHNHRDISTYAVNVRGTQSDALSVGRASNIQWKGDWEAATSLTDYGWSAEIRIPFRILSYSPGDTVFGINFVRYQNRTRELSSWADLTPQNKPEEMGQLTDIPLPAADNPRPWTWKPYLFAGVNIPDETGEIQDSEYTTGIDIRYEPRRDLTAVVTLNPDFSQVEAQVTDIDFSYNEKLLRDPRTFFQEGSSYFGDEEYLYTNRIPDFDYGGKFFGHLGGTRLGVLATQAADDRQDVAVRLTAEYTATDSASLMVVNSDRSDIDNRLTVVEVEGRRPSGLQYRLDHTSSDSDFPAPDSRMTGNATDADLGWRWDHWAIGSGYSRYDVDYLPANGLLNRDLIGTKGIRPYVNFYRDLGDRAIRELSGYVTWSDRDTLDGREQSRLLSAGVSVETRRQIRLGLYRHQGDYRPVIGNPGDFADILHDDRYTTVSLDFNTRSDVLGWGALRSRGRLGGGDYENSYAYLWYRPIDNLQLQVSTEQLKSFGTFRQSIITLGWDINPRNGLAARYISADEGDYTRLAYRRQSRTGIDIFAVVDDGPFGDPEASIKLVWTW